MKAINQYRPISVALTVYDWNSLSKTNLMNKIDQPHSLKVKAFALSFLFLTNSFLVGIRALRSIVIVLLLTKIFQFCRALVRIKSASFGYKIDTAL